MNIDIVTMNLMHLSTTLLSAAASLLKCHYIIEYYFIMLFGSLLRSTTSLISRGTSSSWNTTSSIMFTTFSRRMVPSPSSILTNITERGIAGKALLRTNKSAAKRFRVKGNDGIKRNKAGRSHNTGHKGRKRINSLAASAPINGKKIEDRMRRLIRA